MIFEIEHDLVDEGGIDVIEYYITAENTDTGEVLRHVMTFRSHELFIDPLTGDAEIIERPAGEAESEAQALLTAARQRGAINAVWWRELVPAVGAPFVVPPFTLTVIEESKND